MRRWCARTEHGPGCDPSCPASAKELENGAKIIVKRIAP